MFELKVNGSCSVAVAPKPVAFVGWVQLPPTTLFEEKMVKIELRKWNIIDYFRFLSLTLNSQTRKELERGFFGYILKGIKDIFSKKRDYKFAIIYNEKFVGSIAIYKNDEKDYEIGYFILPKYRKKGIATKAIRKIVNYAFRKLKLKKIKAETDSTNLSSIKSLKNNEFKLTKRNKKGNELIFERRRLK